MSSVRFFENSFTGAQRKGLSSQEVLFYSTTNSAVADSITSSVATFNNKTFLTPPPGLSFDENSFTVYVNGVAITPPTVLVEQSGLNITATFNTSSLGYQLESTDTVILTGKFS